MSLGSAYGYSMGGDPYNFGTMMLPAAGTPLQSTMNTMGYGGAIPGYTGYNTGQTASYQQQLAGQAAQAAGITGMYAAPSQSPYSPGTFVQVDPSQLPSNYNSKYAIGYVMPNGQLQQITDLQAAQMGMTASNVQNIGFNQYMTLAAAPPQQAPQQSLQSVQAYAGMNSQAQQAALAASQATGMYATPGQMMAPGYNNAGASFYQLDPTTQQQYLEAYHDPQSAMQAWVNNSNAAIAQAGGGQGLAAAGTPTETMTAQQQYFNQAQQYAQTYGQYYAPSAPGQTAQAGTNAPQAGQQTLAGQQQQFSQNLQTQQFQQQSAEQYLQLLSQLQGPADYGQYLKVLGSTPSGIQGLVGAAAGNYIPGGGATGVAPQGQSLQNLVGAATGYGGQPNMPGQPQQGAAPGQSQYQQTYQNLMNAYNGQAGTGTGANAATSTPPQSGTASPGGMNYNDFMATAQGLPPPSQIAPQAFGQMAPSQQQMLGSMYSNLGYAPGDINSMYQQSLPKYASGSSAGNFKLV